VLDRETKHPLPSATLRIIGTSKGTVTNSQGQFKISLPEGRFDIAVSYLGYRSDTIGTSSDSGRFRTITLEPNTIELSGVTVTDEDPAYEVIRRAIESKKKWMPQLKTFEGKAFSRLQFRNDSSIAAITESYSTLYWSSDDSIREVVTQQRQTGNLMKGLLTTRVGDIINFNEDRIKLGGYTFVGPTAPNAFEYYDYQLISTRDMDDFEVYTIRVTPRSKIVPLFKGKISIAERSYAVMEVDVTPNEAYTQVFVKMNRSRYRQTFQLFDTKFWLPSNFRFDASLTISLAGIKLPAFGIERDVVIYDYRINPDFADTIKQMNKFTLDSSTTVYDTTFWSENDVLPLTQEQDSAYILLDSTQTLDKRFAPQGAGIKALEIFASTAGIAEVWYNRVEGLHLGADHTFKEVLPDLDLRGNAGYGFSDKEWKYGAGATFRFGKEQRSAANSGIMNLLSKKKQFTLTLDLYDKHRFFPEPLVPGLLLNSLSALFEKEDIHDYFRAAGGSSSLEYIVDAHSDAVLTVLSEYHSSVFQHTDFAVINTKKQFAFQPSILDGRMNSIIGSINYASTGMIAITNDALLVSAKAEYSSANIGSDFDFLQISGKVRGKIATMLRDESVFPPTFGFQIAGSTVAGHLPPQRYSELYSRFETFAGYGSLKGLKRRQFYGDRYISFTVDHNFRRILFVPLGIQWLLESNLDLIVEANAARSWLTGSAIRIPLFPVRDSGGWYYETSIGISNILDLFRVDVTRRLSSPTDWVVSLTVADLLTGFFGQ
jgi:hypothetical protein